MQFSASVPRTTTFWNRMVRRMNSCCRAPSSLRLSACSSVDIDWSATAMWPLTFTSLSSTHTIMMTSFLSRAFCSSFSMRDLVSVILTR